MSMDLKDLTTPVLPPTAPTGAAGADYVQLRTARRKRRRTLGWAMFGLAGLAIGAVWAAGFATSTSTGDTTANTAPPILGSPTAAVDSRFTSSITSVEALNITFSGSWGVIADPTEMYEVNLSTQPAGTYFANVYIDDPLPTGWETLQIEFRILQSTCAAAATSGWATPLASSVMAIESIDSRAVFPGLSNSTYCIGIQSTTKADDPAGTFMRRPNGSAVVTFPVFLASVNQSA